jgi:hypothetical protein
LVLIERLHAPNGAAQALPSQFVPPANLEMLQKGEDDVKWLENCFNQLLLNFTWWVNRKDRTDRNVFEGGLFGTRQHWRL